MNEKLMNEWKKLSESEKVEVLRTFTKNNVLISNKTESTVCNVKNKPSRKCDQ